MSLLMVSVAVLIILLACVVMVTADDFTDPKPLVGGLIGILIGVALFFGGVWLNFNGVSVNSWQALAERVDECTASEHFTREECLILVGKP